MQPQTRHFGTSWPLQHGPARQWHPVTGNKDKQSKDLKVLLQQNLVSSLRNWPSQHGAERKGRREKSQATKYKMYFHWPPKYRLWFIPFFYISLPFFGVKSQMFIWLQKETKVNTCFKFRTSCTFDTLSSSLKFKSKLTRSYLEHVHLWQVRSLFFFSPVPFMSLESA